MEEESVDRFGFPVHISEEGGRHEQVTRCSPSIFQFNLIISLHASHAYDAIRPTSLTCWRNKQAEIHAGVEKSPPHCYSSSLL